MRKSFGVALVIVLAGSVSATADDTGLGPQVQLPVPPPLVPTPQRPRRPLFPIPPLVLPAPRAVPPAAQSWLDAGPRVECGMRRLPVNPNVDPKFVIPLPEAGSANPAPQTGPASPPPALVPGDTVPRYTVPRYTIRRITPPIPCP
jgi:hypothetical protein